MKLSRLNVHAHRGSRTLNQISDFIYRKDATQYRATCCQEAAKVLDQALIGRTTFLTLRLAV